MNARSLWTKHTLQGLALGLSLTLVLAAPAMAETDPAVLKDLQQVLALQGKSCGTVTRAEKRAENDYVVTCSSGDRYRVKIDENDRVVIEKL